MKTVFRHMRAGKGVYLSHFIGMAAVNNLWLRPPDLGSGDVSPGLRLDAPAYGIVLGVGIMLAGTIGMLGSGYVADALSQKGVDDATLRVLFVGTSLMVPFGILGPISGVAWARAAFFVIPVMVLFFAVVACAPTVLQIARRPR